MSRKKKKAAGSAKPASPKISKASAIKAYISEKKKLKLNQNLAYDDFISRTPVTKKWIRDNYGTYAEFKDDAEPAYRKSLPSSQRALLSERAKKYDESATKEHCIEDLRMVQKINDGSFISRTFYREHGKYSDSTWNQFFGTFQEFRRQAGLELTRNQHKLEREIAKHASTDTYRDFISTELLPCYKKYQKPPTKSKIKRIMVISDVHDHEADDFTLDTFVRECKRKQPDIIALNGDIFDLYEFSRYSKDPREYDILGRFQFVWKRIFKALRDACPDAQIDFILGNHEYRLLKLLADATPNIRVVLSDILGLSLADIFKVHDYQINMVSKFDLRAFNAKAINQELKQNYQIYYDCYVICHEPDKKLMVMSGTNGHHHRLMHKSDAYPDPTTGQPKQVTWVQTPAAHVKDAGYLNNMSQWNTGFLEVLVNIERKEVIQKIHQTHSDWTVIDGIIYERKEA